MTSHTITKATTPSGRRLPVAAHTYAVQLAGDYTGASRVLITLPHEGRADLRTDLARIHASLSSPFSFTDFEINHEIEWPKDERLAPCGKEPDTIWELVDQLH